VRLVAGGGNDQLILVDGFKGEFAPGDVQGDEFNDDVAVLPWSLNGEVGIVKVSG
jgi:hypothetical protein